jgi:hypothetical protein
MDTWFSFEVELQTCLCEYWNIFDDDSLELLKSVSLALIFLFLKHKNLIKFLFLHDEIFTCEDGQVLFILTFLDGEYFIRFSLVGIQQSHIKFANLLEGL